MTKRVLVFPCGTEIGLEIHQALRWSTHVELFGASSVSSNHGKFVYKNYFEGLPFVGEPDFLRAINEVVTTHHIDFICPAHDDAVLALAEYADRLACRVIGSPVETCRVCRSKNKTYDTFASLLPVPARFDPSRADLPFPVFVKPDVGQGSKGAAVAKTRKQLDLLLDSGVSNLVLEYLPGPEFTVDCFTDRAGALRFVGARTRDRIVNGISVDTSPVPTEPFQPIAETINRSLKFRGAWFFQMKERASGERVLMEIAPRIAGGMALFRCLGVNFPLLSVFDASDIDVAVTPLRHSLHMDRALINRYQSNLQYDSVYIDLDDTIIRDGRLNPWIVAFLVQARSAGKKIHLISRHAADIAATLREHRIESFFDSVTHLAPGQPKSDAVTDASAIFIDDSFSERLEVAEKRNIPAFDTAAVECLIDWKA